MVREHFAGSVTHSASPDCSKHTKLEVGDEANWTPQDWGYKHSAHDWYCVDPSLLFLFLLGLLLLLFLLLQIFWLVICVLSLARWPNIWAKARGWLSPEVCYCIFWRSMYCQRYSSARNISHINIIQKIGSQFSYITCEIFCDLLAWTFFWGAGTGGAGRDKMASWC